MNGSEVLTLRDILPTCRHVGDLLWCYNDGACGQDCNDVCAAMGSQPIASNTEWFEAQDTAEECQALADAFGVSTASLTSISRGCLVDSPSNPHPETGLTDILFCSTFSTCPSELRSTTDLEGVDCADGFALRTICPCKGAIPFMTP